MYAFEVQQPETAKSKLDGLRTHYSLPSTAEPYFEVHSANWHESQKILTSLEKLPVVDQTKARQACERMSETLWNALTGIYEKACIQQ
jgi:pyrroloquinoline quinone (PQQ) biosynthesis protein C